MPCPFEAKLGFSTKKVRKEYLELIADDGCCQSGASYTQIDAEAIDRLEADLDQSKPLFFWQLYSILGKDPIIAIVTTFYNLIWADDNTDEGATFKAAFASVGDIEMHIKAQSAYWIDSFGGGRVYWGGHSRLGFHHYSRHAEPVMTAAGANRWMAHMRYALSSYDFSSKGIQEFKDPRIVPAIVGFVHAKMRAYALEFGWELDESVFEIERFSFPPKMDIGYIVQLPDDLKLPDITWTDLGRKHELV